MIEVISRVLAGFACLLAAAQSPAAESVSPRNPFLHGDSIYVSANGVSRYHPSGFARQWRALAGVHTFEPVVAAGLVLVGSSQGLYALDPSSGEIEWHVASDTTVFSPIVAGGTVYAASQSGVLRALVARDGSRIWSHRFEGWVYPPAFDRGMLVLGGSSGRLYGVDADSAEVAWSRPVSQELVYRPVRASPGVVLVTTFAGDLYAISSTDGSTLWRIRETAAGFPPLSHDGRLYMGAFDGTLRARNLSDGSLVWARPVADKLPYMPYVHDDQIVVASDSGRVAALDLASGRPLWLKELRVNIAAGPVVIDGMLITVSETGELSIQALPGEP